MATARVDWSAPLKLGSRCVSELARGLVGFWFYWLVKEGRGMRFIFVAEVNIFGLEGVFFGIVWVFGFLFCKTGWRCLSMRCMS